MKKIIVTGATGFIGRNLVRVLVDKGHYVYAVIRNNPAIFHLLPKHDNIKIINLNMCEYGRLDDVIMDQCDIFISAAWEGTRGAHRNNCNLQRENYEYSIEAVKAATRLQCKEIILIGSQAEYGIQTCKISESVICKPDTEYGKWKLQLYTDVEGICKNLNIKYKEIRLFSIYGPGDYENSLIMSTIKKMLKDENCEFTTATQIWDYLYIDDAVEGIYALINADCSNGVYNIGSGKSKPLKEYIMELQSTLGSNSHLIFGALNKLYLDNYSANPDIEKFNMATGGNALKTSFSDGINKIIKETSNEGQ